MRGLLASAIVLLNSSLLGVLAGLLGLSSVVVHWFLARAGGVYSVELSKFDDALDL